VIFHTLKEEFAQGIQAITIKLTNPGMKHHNPGWEKISGWLTTES